VGLFRSSVSLGTNPDRPCPWSSVNEPRGSIISRPPLRTSSPFLSEVTIELFAELLWKTGVESVVTFSIGAFFGEWVAPFFLKLAVCPRGFLIGSEAADVVT